MAQQTLQELIGEAPSEALTVLIGREAFSRPAAFVRELSKFFPAGAIVTCNLIEKQAAASVLSANSIPEVARFEAVALRKGLPPVTETESPKSFYLHDHRAEDELDKLVGHKTT